MSNFSIFLACRPSLRDNQTPWAARSYPYGKSWSVGFAGVSEGTDEVDALSEALLDALDDLDKGVPVTIHTTSEAFYTALLEFTRDLPYRLRAALIDRSSFNVELLTPSAKSARYQETFSVLEEGGSE